MHFCVMGCITARWCLYQCVPLSKTLPNCTLKMDTYLWYSKLYLNKFDFKEKMLSDRIVKKSEKMEDRHAD